MISAVSTDKAPQAVGPYSQAIRAGDLLFISGQLPIDPDTGAFNSPDAVAQAEQCLKNLKAIAESAGTSLLKTVKTTVLVVNLDEFAAINEVYAKYFGQPYPARACYQVSALPKGAKVEIEAVVALA